MAGINRNNGDVTTAPQGQSVGRDGKGGYGLSNMARYTGQGSWEPTTMFLVILVILEVIGYGALRYAFKGAHGG